MGDPSDILGRRNPVKRIWCIQAFLLSSSLKYQLTRNSAPVNISGPAITPTIPDHSRSVSFVLVRQQLDGSYFEPLSSSVSTGSVYFEARSQAGRRGGLCSRSMNKGPERRLDG